MANISDAEELRLLDLSLDGTYLALSTADPLDDGTGFAEISGNGYARPAITFAPAAAGAKSNSALLSFTAAGGNWPQATHVAIMSAVTAGTQRWHGSLSAAKTLLDGETLEIPVGDLTASLD